MNHDEQEYQGRRKKKKEEEEEESRRTRFATLQAVYSISKYKAGPKKSQVRLTAGFASGGVLSLKECILKTFRRGGIKVGTSRETRGSQGDAVSRGPEKQ